MSDCPIRLECLFFRDVMSNMPAATTLMKKTYCAGGHSTCARWIVRSKLGSARVPEDLFPNQRHRLAEILGPDPEQAE